MTDEEAYRTLAVEPGSDAKAVQQAYRLKALEAHPDRAGSDTERAVFTKRFMKIRDAYAHLRDSGFPVPEPQEVVEDPPELRRTYQRSFAKPWDEDEEFSQAEKLGFKFAWSPEQVLLWGVVIPGGALGTVWFLRFLIRVLHGE
ncbi:MAG: hypothetical protein AUJ52_08000 [Elusimicrobia bacterium CG1_02_63_36]|nr:MAG: hypothetical protein AUJ52_08000 [Elusimicrobia bacterium CG1_02_63_36]PIP82204.1 MAG: hypothetical protein COR54_16070 [Elusimicrobia bacterium CG22_combo_CG10-13_8_21_14_all_63_91]PJA12786.1 MAG: hypothetical protein COX66_16440 [Elusimicrobia bacterium CG_4_10_14_0_2_um_filter_63_34]PJB23002.1 MAG: hypothetical protein CO113_19640 [Elusimicrobia bacterium CG_4_9_14_3_um_filter_62_55]